MSVPQSLAASGRAMRREILRRATGPQPRLAQAPNRAFHQSARRSTQAQAVAATAKPPPVKTPINDALSFPCLDATEQRTQRLATKKQRSSLSAGPEPSYTTGKHELFHSSSPLLLDWGGVLPEFNIAYETWGALNTDKSNAILVHTGLSASSHAKSTERNPKPGWWEKFIGPGAPLDTDRYHVICTNVIGGCYGSTGPSSVDKSGGEGGSRRYATRFPVLTMQDMVRAQFRLLDHLGIAKLYASVGSSMGGMQSLAAGVLEPERVGRVATISGCARSHPYSIAMRHTQRQVLMNDPAWASTRGDYYDAIPPHTGMKLAREIATITYRSGPEWEQRFGRRRADPSKPPALCPDFLIETYLDHAGEKWCLEYDANSLLYVSKAMDLFDLGAEHMGVLERTRKESAWKLEGFGDAAAAHLQETEKDRCNLVLPDTPYEEQESSAAIMADPNNPSEAKEGGSGGGGPPADLVKGLAAMKDTPTLVLGVASDILFPAWQQREIAETLRRAGNRSVTHVELGEDRSLFGHDTFLLDLEGVGGEIRRFLG